MQNEKIDFDFGDNERVSFDVDGKNEIENSDEATLRHTSVEMADYKPAIMNDMNVVPLLPDGNFVGVNEVSEKAIDTNYVAYKNDDAVLKAVENAIDSNGPYEMVEQIQMISENYNGE